MHTVDKEGSILSALKIEHAEMATSQGVKGKDACELVRERD